MADTPRWLEVSLVVNGELAEAVADVLGRYTTNGVVVESDVRYNDAEDEGTPVGPVRVYGFLPVDDKLEHNRHKLEEALWYLGRVQALPPLSFRTLEDEDWMAAWKKHYQPIRIGRRLLVLPAWLDEPRGSRVVVKIDPSMAFGTGTHPTTQLCLEALERAMPAGIDVIDVGCGSGILSVAAIKLGARHTLSVDLDSQAVRSTHENAAANHVEAQVEAAQGSVAEVLAGKFSIKSAPLVLANILAPVIIRLFDAGLHALVEPGGSLILSGILDTQADSVLAAAQRKGLREVERLQQSDWVAMVMQA